MRSSSLPCLLGCAIALALPSTAVAQDYTPFRQNAQFDPLPIEGTTTPVTVLNTAAISDGYVSVGIPFVFWFYGSAFQQVNMSSDGFVTFGTDPTGMGKANHYNNQPIPTTDAPTGLVAAWWDDNSCPINGADGLPGSMRSQVFGELGQQVMVLEWNGCTRLTSVLRMQVWLMQPSTIRVYYGDALAGTSAHTATVGLENPATYDLDGTVLTTGGTRGTYGLLKTDGTAECGAACDRANWPAHKMVQYGRSRIPDLQAGRLWTSELDTQTTEDFVFAAIGITIDNVGHNDAGGVVWDHYLSKNGRLDDDDELLENCRHDTPETVPGADSGQNNSLTSSTACTFPLPPPGSYHLCTRVYFVDTEVKEANAANNSWCTESFVIGSDLVGSVAILPQSGVSSRTPVTVEVRNAGTDPAERFDFTIIWKDCEGEYPDLLAYTGTLSLPGGKPHNEVLELFLDSSIKPRYLCAELVIDPAGDIPELFEDNNVSSTCVEPGLVCMELLRPDLRVNKIVADMPHGCFFDDGFGLEIEFCNDGSVPATNFGIVFSLDTNTIVTLDDTQVLAVPESCAVVDFVTGDAHDDPLLCNDLGGGSPACIRGSCHPPCTEDRDCGDAGLVCLDDPLLEVGGVKHSSCQFAISGHECKWIRSLAIVPSINTRAATKENPEGIPFTDGVYYVGAIIDWIDLIVEDDKGNNKMSSDARLTCWTRRPDFEAVELRSVTSIGAGEPFPVYRKVKNNGVVEGNFTYQYVLSSNQTPSKFDVPLDVLRVEDGEIVGRDRTVNEMIGPLGLIDTRDTVVVPANVVPGRYYLGIVIDPEDDVLEVSEENNGAIWCDPQPDGVCAPIPIQVVASSFRIVTQSLPNAIAGQSYDVQLLAAGGVGGFQWRVSSGELPPGIALESGGRIHGTVAEKGDYVFRVTVSSSSLSASATFAIRVISVGGPLVITTVALPVAYVDTNYEAALGTSGGASPYDWTCHGLPAWALLDRGIVRGVPTGAADPIPVTCTVTDANQQAVSAVYSLQVMAASNLRIDSTAIGSFNRGEASSAMIDAAGGSGSYRWTIDDATLPTGLRAVGAGNRGAIEGTPAICGYFLVGVVVTDTVSNATDSAELPLVVVCDAPRLTTRDVPVAVRGEDYPETSLVAERTEEFVVVSGELPRGLELSKTGVLSGKVEPDADTGYHNVAVELRDGAGGTGLGALTIMVQPEPGPTIVGIDKVSKGCSASGEGSASGLLPLAALLALSGFRRRWVGRAAGTILLATLAAMAPTTASAQDGGYSTVMWDIQYERLEGATPAMAACSGFDTCVSPAIPLPFTFTFFDVAYNQIWLDSNGLLHFIHATSYTGNATIPNSAAPNGFIAPWWDDLEVIAGNGIRYLTRGIAPNREFVVEFLVEYYSLNNSEKDLAEMQISLYEGDYFAIRWGNPGIGLTASATTGTVGIEDATGSARSIAILSCTPSCKQADWEAHLMNKEMLFSTGLNLAIGETSTSPVTMAGSEYEFRAWARNTSMMELDSPIELYISDDLQISRDDYFIGRTPDLRFGVGQAVQASITAPVPKSLVPGAYYLLARVDPDDAIEEFREVDNDGGTFRFVVPTPMPDFAFREITGPASGSAGSWIAVELDVVNLGNLAVQGVPYTIVLSDNDVITEFDLMIHRGFFDIGSNTNAALGVLVELPVDMPPGLYYLGALIDPANVVPENDELNNVRASERPIAITTDGLRVVTHLPDVLQVGAPHCTPLEAEGGDGVYTWSLVEGTLPPGLVIDPGGEGDSDGAWICGVPTAVGTFSFTLELASGGVTRLTAVSLEVLAVPAALDVATRVLPIGSFNAPYEAGLSANGGRPPYRWELLSGELPAGLTLDPDGLIYGMPLVDGEFSLEVRLQDADANTAAASVSLGISSPGWITCSTRTLGSVEVGSEMGGRLLVGGGTGSYVWKSVRTVRFGDSGAPPLATPEGPPPGIELRATGVLEGIAEQIGRYLWTVEVSDAAVPDNVDTCTISLEVLPGPGLTVTTTAMPIALVDEEYRVQLQAVGGDGIYRWTLVDRRDLPTGLDLGESGVVSGVLATADLEENESRTWSFLVEVRDGRNNGVTGAMAVTLTTRKDGATVPWRTETTESGCSTGGESVRLVALGLVVLGLRRRW